MWRAFTLVELLVVMVIITMLASMALVAMWGAQEEARIQRTRAQIAKIHEILLPHFENYATRPVRFPSTFQLDPRRGRLMLLRDYMRMEFPDRQNDVIDPPLFNAPLPVLRSAIQRRVEYMQNDLGLEWTKTFEQAECLYLILSCLRVDDRSALSYFRDTEIGDVDNDGFFEILDAWGNPISFLRWAPGYADDPQTGRLSPSFIQYREIPDPFDPLRLDPRWEDGDPLTTPFILFPLVFSAGPSAYRDFDNMVDYGLELGGEDFRYYQPTESAWHLRMDPFRPYGNVLIGTPRATATGQRAFDNLITNHSLESP